MKIRYFLSAVVILAMVGSVQGNSVNVSSKSNKVFLLQPPGGGQQRTPEERAKRETQWMKDSLALSPEQVILVDTINLKYAKKQADLRTQMEGQDREAWRPKMQELQEQKSGELKKVLTEDQMKKYADMAARRRFGRGQGGPRQ
jgi:hypothetical protein